MIERLLIANRGEIARRIMRTCRDLGVETVAVHSDADAEAAFVFDADRAVPIGGDTPAESYLRIDAILDAAARTGADAVHPGYGFLAENAEFARAVLDAGLTFVGPRPEVIAVMGSKLEAKARMADAGVPLLGSAELTGLEAAELTAAGESIGYPMLIKASAGGGGRGMRIVEAPGGLADAVTAAAREATSAFGDGTVYGERYVSPSRHVEVQIFGDDNGRVVHFGERECSIQRRYQKIIEEAPSPSLDAGTREALHAAAVRAGEAIGYTNAGTVEFLLAPPGDDGRSEFFFLEVNTRLQVEHPVTEAVHGVDLVELQLHVAAGGAVPTQDEIGEPEGHAIEARIYAEDPTADYRPSTGAIGGFSVPVGVRLDAAFDATIGPGEWDPDRAEPVATVTQFYDPMIAKVIASGPNRTVAARRLASALAATAIDGVTTNRDLLVRTLRHPEYLGGDGDSDFLTRHDPAHLGRPLLEGEDRAVAAAAAALALQAANRATDRHTSEVATGFRNVATAPQRVTLQEGDAPIELAYRFSRGRLVDLAVDGEPLPDPVARRVEVDGVDLVVGGVRRQFEIGVGPSTIAVVGPDGAAVFGRAPRFAEPDAGAAPGSTVASMPGTIVSVAVGVGDSVTVGDPLVVMEAMKMELAISASVAGTVAEVNVAPGDTVDAGTVLVVVADDGADGAAPTGVSESRNSSAPGSRE